MQTAIARRGVSVVALPGDIALCEAVVEHPRLKFPPPQPSVCPSDDEITKLAKVLNDSEKITILAGAGCAGRGQLEDGLRPDDPREQDVVSGLRTR